jgi:hypothetical protein
LYDLIRHWDLKPPRQSEQARIARRSPHTACRACRTCNHAAHCVTTWCCEMGPLAVGVRSGTLPAAGRPVAQAAGGAGAANWVLGDTGCWAVPVCCVCLCLRVCVVRGAMARGAFLVSRFSHRAPAFSGQMGSLSMKPELATRHDPQTTHRPEKFASNPTPVASNAAPCTHRAS